MPNPGVTVTTRAASPARGQTTETGTAFVVDFADWGPNDAAAIVYSLDEFTRLYGDRVGYSFAHDALELAFAEGLAQAYVTRQTGPAPVKAARILVDRAGAPVNTLRIDGLYVGDRGNRLTVSVEDDGANFLLIIKFDGVEVERFTALASPAAAVTALETSEYVRGVNLASGTAGPNNNPAVVANAALTGGTDDHASATNAHFNTALTRFTKDLGPGQLLAPGRTDLASHTSLMDHARLNNRVALLDVPDQASKVTLTAAVQAVDDLPGHEFAAMIGTWFEIPGLTANTVRAVPGSAFAAGVINRVDAVEGTAGAAAAGEASQAQYATGIRTPAGGFTDTDYTDLNNEGVDMARGFRESGVQLYGFRTVSNDADWLSLTHARLRVSLTARLESRANGFVFKTINKRELARLNNELTAECLIDYNAGALYGDSPEDAFSVDTSDILNTPATAAAGDMVAAVYARFAEFAEQVLLTVVKVPVTSPVSS